MIVNERIVAYINSLDRGNSPICNTIEKEAIEDDVPIIRKEMGNLLKVLLELKQPQSILEVGTAVGYSSILMSENMPEGCIIDTIENYDKRIPIARNNFKRAGKEDCIRLIEGDADILLIDEILAVGDANYQAKCFNKLREIKAEGTTIVIVSHSLGQIEQMLIYVH